MAIPTRTIRVRFDGTAKGLIKAAAEAGIAVEGFEKQAKKSTSNIAKSTSLLGDGLADVLGALPSQLKGAAIVAGAGIGAVMAPALASAIIAGVLLAVGGGVLAAGIVGAAKSPKVAAAWKKFGTQAGKVFEKFSQPFIKPLVRAADTFSRALRRAEPTIRAIGATLAPVVDKLSPAFALMAERALPGILAAAQASVPLFDVLANHLPGIGLATAQFFEAIAAGLPGAQVFFDRFLGWVETLLPKLGGFITWLSDLGTKMEQFAKGPEITALRDSLINLKDKALAGVSEGFDKIKKSIEDNSATWKQLGKDISKALGEAGPAVQYFVVSTAASLAFIIDVWAKLYDAIRKVYVILRELFKGSDTLPTTGGQEFGKIPGRAYGGPVTAGRSYLVGEKGKPELFTPGASGYITPLDKMGAAIPGSGGQAVEVHVHFDDPALRDLVRVEIRESNRSTRRAVLAGAGAR